MKIPEKIRINGIDYHVEIAKGSLRENGEILLGEIDYLNSTIYLSGEDGTEHKRRCVTLWHEIIHGILDAADAHPEDKALEEKICNVLSSGVYQVLQDNGREFFDIVPPEILTVKNNREEAANVGN